MLRIFTPAKTQWLRSGLNPQTWVPEASMLTTRPPKPSMWDMWWKKWHCDRLISQYNGFPCECQFTSVPHLSSSACCSNQKYEWAKPGNLSKAVLFWKPSSIRLKSNYLKRSPCFIFSEINIFQIRPFNINHKPQFRDPYSKPLLSLF